MTVSETLGGGNYLKVLCRSSSLDICRKVEAMIHIS